jgi:hypothetical protein
MNWKKRAALHFLMYAVDMTVAMLGFVLAFGLTVKNWPALILLPLVTRWALHLVNTAIMSADARSALGKGASND